MTLEQALVRMETLGHLGYVVSVCYGPTVTNSSVARWSVLVSAPDGQEFDRPYAAQNFTHAIEIAVIEITRRQWIPQVIA
jgi:hypothetical protein